jgi:NDP-sugar pyrophosphorylase family protein
VEVDYMNDEMKVVNLFDLTKTMAESLLLKVKYPWDAVPRINELILSLGNSLSLDEYTKIGDDVWISKSAKIYPNNYIAGPAIIGPGTEVRPGAFIRGNALVGSGAVIGNSTELKNVIIFDGVEVPHYNYVGDSILGYKAHLGAGAITSNIKQDRLHVTVVIDGVKTDTGLRKLGAILGDKAEVGCNSVLNPGTVIGRGARVYPLSMVRGFIPANSIYKSKGEITEIR